MQLEPEEEEILSGAKGRAVEKAMQLLVALGEVLGAKRLIPIESAQIAGVSYGNIGDAGMEFLEEWASLGAKVQVKTTLNPAGMDLGRWREMGVDEAYHAKQMRIIRAFERMGVQITCTCTPYLVGNQPRRGSHIAWSESSAICYANSVLGAMTNREGGPSALAAALAGRTPYYGLHLKKNRRPTIIVDVKARLASTYDYSLLGYTVGRMIGSGIPMLVGLGHPDLDRMKIMCAALAASGGIAMFHVEGLTKEGSDFRLDSLERFSIDQEELKASRDMLTSEGDPDFACLGCPHCSFEEMAEIAQWVKGRRVDKGKGLWVLTSKEVYEQSKGRGYVEAIEGAGGKVFADTCMVVCPLERSRYGHMVSNSCKAVHYVPSTSKLKASVAEMCSAIDKVLVEGK